MSVSVLALWPVWIIAIAPAASMPSIITVDGARHLSPIIHQIKSRSLYHIEIQTLNNVTYSKIRGDVGIADKYVMYSDCTSDIRDCIRQVCGTCRIDQVLPGFEGSVTLAETIAEALHCPTNDPALKSARRNKHAMQLAVQSHGLEFIHTILLTGDNIVQHHQLANEVLQASRSGEIVVKPAESGGSDQVRVFKTSGAALKHAYGILDVLLNAVGQKNTAVVLQERIDGHELLVNTVSKLGVHKIISVWIYEKQDRVYLSQTLLNCTDKGVRRKFDIANVFIYVKAVLDSIGVKNGPAHTEIMLRTGIDGVMHDPVLIETGARLEGGYQDEFNVVKECLGHDQSSAYFAAFYGADGEWSHVPATPGSLQCGVKTVFIAAPQSGTLKETPPYHLIAGMPSFKMSLDMHYGLLPKAGSQIRQTVDVLTSLGLFVLSHKNASVIDEDYQRFKDIQMRNLFWTYVGTKYISTSSDTSLLFAGGQLETQHIPQGSAPHRDALVRSMCSTCFSNVTMERLRAFRTDPHAVAILFEGVHVDEVGEFPSALSWSSQWILGSLTAYFGMLVGYEEKQSRSLYKDIYSGSNSSDSSYIGNYTSDQSQRVFGWHVENLAHPHMPHYVLMLCLKQDTERIVETLLLPGQSVVRHLSTSSLAILQEPRFHLAIEDTLDLDGIGIIPEAVPVLEEQQGGSWRINLDSTFLKPALKNDTAAQSALDELLIVAERCYFSIKLKAGDVLVWDNTRVAHDRQFTGTNRWLKRTHAFTGLVSPFKIFKQADLKFLEGNDPNVIQTKGAIREVFERSEL